MAKGHNVIVSFHGHARRLGVDEGTRGLADADIVDLVKEPGLVDRLRDMLDRSALDARLRASDPIHQAMDPLTPTARVPLLLTATP